MTTGVISEPQADAGRGFHQPGGIRFHIPTPTKPNPTIHGTPYLPLIRLDRTSGHSLVNGYVARPQDPDGYLPTFLQACGISVA